MLRAAQQAWKNNQHSQAVTELPRLLRLAYGGPDAAAAEQFARTVLANPRVGAGLKAALAKQCYAALEQGPDPAAARRWLDQMGFDRFRR